MQRPIRRLGLAAIVLMACQTGLAQRPAHSGGRHGRPCLAQLSLSEEQTTSLRALRENASPEVRTLVQTLRTEVKKLREMVHSGAGEQEIAAQKLVVQGVKTQLAPYRAQQLQAVRAILTAEKVQQFDTCLAQHGGTSSYDEEE